VEGAENQAMLRVMETPTKLPVAKLGVAEAVRAVQLQEMLLPEKLRILLLVAMTIGGSMMFMRITRMLLRTTVSVLRAPELRLQQLPWPLRKRW
jgi:hypothetical protein